VTAAARGSSRPRIAVIVPVYNDAAALTATLRALASQAETVIVVDGGSDDASVQSALAAGVRVLDAPRGRALQMNAGARCLLENGAAGDVDGLLFLHADTLLPAGGIDAIRGALANGAAWGRFNVHFDQHVGLLRLVATLMNARSRWTGICTGDQAIFVRAGIWRQVGGFAPQPLMEDIELSARLKRIAWPVALHPPVITSARRWRRDGVLRTIARMWWLRARYFFGASPQALHAAYYRDREFARR
jgi:rSAM/selenodomain-associated transferase 2